MDMEEIALDGELIASEGELSWEAKAEAEGTWSIFSGTKAAEEHQRNAAKEYQRGRDRREVRLWKHGRAFSPAAWFGNETSEWCGRAGWTD